MYVRASVSPAGYLGCAFAQSFARSERGHSGGKFPGGDYVAGYVERGFVGVVERWK